MFQKNLYRVLYLSLFVWQSQDQPVEAQQNDQQELQITLQEMIDMINSSMAEETMVSNII